jgi:hypothetical protein
MRSNNRIDGARSTAMGAADAECFINDRNNASRLGLFGKREYVFAEQGGEALHGIVPARRAEIDRNFGLDDSRCIGPAAWIATLSTLGLW